MTTRTEARPGIVTIDELRDHLSYQEGVQRVEAPSSILNKHGILNLQREESRAQQMRYELKQSARPRQAGFKSSCSCTVIIRSIQSNSAFLRSGPGRYGDSQSIQ